MSPSKPLLLSLGLLASLPACAEEPTVHNSGIHLTHEGDRTVLSVEGVFGWWRNAVDDETYEGWSTEYEHTGWELASTDAQLRLTQEPGVALGASLQLPADHSIDFTTPPDFGIGWRAVYPETGRIPFDLDALGVAPQADNIDFSKCSVQDTRVLVSLSRYKGSQDELWAMAEESAIEQGLPAPQNWYDVVRDPIMYEFLFGENKILTLDYAYFAFFAVQINPRCADMQLTLHVEDQLVGPIIRD